MLIALLLLQSGVPASAWEAKAKNVEARLQSHPHPMTAPQLRKPGWARKIQRADKRVHWTQRYDGKLYLFGVGLVQGVDNAELRITAAEDRARASLADGLASPAPTPGPRPGETEKRVERVLLGSQILDWYLDGEGNMYALAVVRP